MGFVRRHSLWLVLCLLGIINPKCSFAADVTLAWDANTETNLTGYKVYYGTTPGTYSNSVPVGLQSSYTVSGLQPGTWYFAVTALNAAGESAYSNQVSRVVDTTPPVISAVQSINVLSSGATITWTTNEASDSQVEYGLTTGYGNLTSLNTTLVTTHSQALPGLAANTVYHYRVKSKDAAGNLAVSTDFSFTTAQSADTTPPVISTVSSGGITSSGAAISWTTNEASDTQVEYGTTTAYGSLTSCNSTPVTAHAQTLSGLGASTAYHFRVRSKDSAGNLAISGDFTFTTAASGGVTAIPAFVQANAFEIRSGSSISVSFPSSNTAGNLIVAYVVWDNRGPVTLSDSRGNSYSSAVGPTKYSGDRTMAQIFYARNIGSGSNTVKASFSTAITAWGLLYIHEYSGIDSVSPLAGAIGGSGSAAAMNSGSLANVTANSLLFAGGESNNQITSAGTGFTARSTYAGNITEDRIVTSMGAYASSATQNGSAWVLQLAAFKAKVPAPADTTAPQITAVTSTEVTSSSATVTWTTNEASDSQVEYGLTTSYGSTTALNSNLVTTHSANLSGLTCGTAYHYRVRSRDAAGNLALSADYTLQTATPVTAAPKFVQEMDAAVVSGGGVSASFANYNTAGNLIVAYVLWDNSGPVALTDSRGNVYSSAIGPTKYSGSPTNAQIFYARNVAGGSNTVRATFSTPVTQYGLLYVHEYSGLDLSAPVESAIAGTGYSSTMNSGSLTTLSSNALLFAGGVSSASVMSASSGFTVRSTRDGNLTEDRIAATAGTYSATASQNSNAWIMQLVAFKAAVQQTTQTTMALPLMTSATTIRTAAAAESYTGLSAVNADTVPATLTFTAVDSTGMPLSGPGISNPAVRTLNPGEQLRVVDQQLFGSGLADSRAGGWIKLESSTPKIGGYYAVFNNDLSLYQGSEMAAEPLRTTILPEIGDSGAMDVIAANPNSETGTVSIDIVGPDGKVRKTADYDVQPNGALTSLSLGSLLGGPESGSRGYIRLRANSAIQAFELVQNRKGKVVMVNGLDQGAGAHELYAVSYDFGNGAASALNIINLDSKEGIVRLTPYGENSRQIGPSRSLPIAPNGAVIIDDPQFFQLYGEPGDQGYIQIHSNEVRLAGIGSFDHPGRQRTPFALPLVSKLQNSVLLSNAAHNGLFSTAINLLNPSEDDVSATVELYTAAGSLIASAADTVAPHQRSSRTIKDYFPTIVGRDWDSGYVRIHTDNPIAVFSPVENTDSGIISVIPAQEVR